MSGSGPLVEILHEIEARDGHPLTLTELMAAGSAGAPGADPASSGRRLGPAGTVVLLHGFAQNRSAYIEGLLPQALLARGMRVLVAELRGHGRSRRPGHAYRHGLEHHLEADLPAILEAACARTEVEAVTVVGHSMGGILGYALLAAPSRMAGLVTLGAPVVLGTGRPVLRAAARAVGPLVRRFPEGELPMGHLLRALAPLVVLPPRRGPGRVLRELIRLGNPREADADGLRRILTRADPAAREVFLHLVDIIERGRAVIGGVDLEAALAASATPVVAVVAGRDIFAPRVSVEPILRGGGLRRIVEWPQAAHVDLTMGHRTGELADLVVEVARSRS